MAKGKLSCTAKISKARAAKIIAKSEGVSVPVAKVRLQKAIDDYHDGYYMGRDGEHYIDLKAGRPMRECHDTRSALRLKPAKTVKTKSRRSWKAPKIDVGQALIVGGVTLASGFALGRVTKS